MVNRDGTVTSVEGSESVDDVQDTGGRSESVDDLEDTSGVSESVNDLEDAGVLKVVNTFTSSTWCPQGRHFTSSTCVIKVVTFVYAGVCICWCASIITDCNYSIKTSTWNPIGPFQLICCLNFTAKDAGLHMLKNAIATNDLFWAHCLHSSQLYREY